MKLTGKLLLGKYIVGKQIGNGQQGSVYYGTELNTNPVKEIAIKAINQSLLKAKEKELLQTEISVMKQMKSNHIVKMYDTFEFGIFRILVLEYCNEGTLSELMQKNNNEIVDRVKIKMFKEIILAFKELHSKLIMHRDIKLQNILVHNGQLKLCDFGFSKQIDGEEEICETLLGTRGTMAPELLEYKPYGIEAEMYSMGVVFYQISKQKFPYFAMNPNQLAKKIKEGNLDCSGLSDELTDLLKNMLEYDYKKRIQWKDLLKHNFFNSDLTFFTSVLFDNEEEKEKEESQQFYINFKIHLENSQKSSNIQINNSEGAENNKPQENQTNQIKDIQQPPPSQQNTLQNEVPQQKVEIQQQYPPISNNLNPQNQFNPISPTQQVSQQLESRFEELDQNSYFQQSEVSQQNQQQIFNLQFSNQNQQQIPNQFSSQPFQQQPYQNIQNQQQVLNFQSPQQYQNQDISPKMLAPEQSQQQMFNFVNPVPNQQQIPNFQIPLQFQQLPYQNIQNSQQVPYQNQLNFQTAQNQQQIFQNQFNQPLIPQANFNSQYQHPFVPIEQANPSNLPQSSEINSMIMKDQTLEQLQLQEDQMIKIQLDKMQCDALYIKFIESQQNYTYMMMAVKRLVSLNTICEEKKQNFVIYIYPATMVLIYKISLMREKLVEELNSSKYIFFKSKEPEKFKQMMKQLESDGDYLDNVSFACEIQYKETQSSVYDVFRNLIDNYIMCKNQQAFEQDYYKKMRVILIDLLIDISTPTKIIIKGLSLEDHNTINRIIKQAGSYLALSCLVEKPNVNLIQVEKRLLEENYRLELKRQLTSLIDEVDDSIKILDVEQEEEKQGKSFFKNLKKMFGGKKVELGEYKQYLHPIKNQFLRRLKKYG